MAAHGSNVEKIAIAGIPFADTKLSVKKYYEKTGGMQTFEKAVAAIPEAKQDKALKRLTDSDVGLDASVAALVCIGVRSKDGTVTPHFMIYDSARKDWAGKSLVAINGKIEKDEQDPLDTMRREIQEELLNSDFGKKLSAKVTYARINGAPHYSTNKIGPVQIAKGDNCYVNRTSFVFGGTYSENELNEELKKINASMERLLGNDNAPASLFIKHVPPGPQPATACKDPLDAKEEILKGLNALLDWHNENNPEVGCPLTLADYAALRVLCSDISSEKLDLSKAEDVAVIKNMFEHHVYCYTEAKKIRVLSAEALYAVAEQGKTTDVNGEQVLMSGFIHTPLKDYLSTGKEKAESWLETEIKKEDSKVYGRSGSPVHYQLPPVDAIGETQKAASTFAPSSPR